MVLRSGQTNGSLLSIYCVQWTQTKVQRRFWKFWLELTHSPLVQRLVSRSSLLPGPRVPASLWLAAPLPCLDVRVGAVSEVEGKASICAEARRCLGPLNVTVPSKGLPWKLLGDGEMLVLSSPLCSVWNGDGTAWERGLEEGMLNIRRGP